MTPEPDRETVLRPILVNTFPKEVEDLMVRVKWTSLDGNWWVVYHGIYVGIEPDGYVHS